MYVFSFSISYLMGNNLARVVGKKQNSTTSVNVLLFLGRLLQLCWLIRSVAVAIGRPGPRKRRRITFQNHSQLAITIRERARDPIFKNVTSNLFRRAGPGRAQPNWARRDPLALYFESLGKTELSSTRQQETKPGALTLHDRQPKKNEREREYDTRENPLSTAHRKQTALFSLFLSLFALLCALTSYAYTQLKTTTTVLHTNTFFFLAGKKGETVSCSFPAIFYFAHFRNL